MIVLQLEQEVAASPYFVAHHLQRGASGARSWVVSGTLGDGWYEGEVVVEIGTRSDITFADEWFDRVALQGFFDRFGRDQICGALIRALDSGTFEQALWIPEGGCRPDFHDASCAGHGLTGSGEPNWAVAA